MVVAISKKRCGCYTNSCQDEYKMRPKGPIYNKHEGENTKDPKHNPRRWVMIKFVARRWLVGQSTSWGHNICIWSLIWDLDIPLGRSIQDLHILSRDKFKFRSPESLKNIVEGIKTTWKVWDPKNNRKIWYKNTKMDNCFEPMK